MRLLVALVLLFFTGASAQTLRLGAVLPLSGPAAATGRAAAAALGAAADNLADGGLEVELTVFDSRGDPTTAAEGVRALLSGGVHALVCCENVALAASLAPLAGAEDVPTFGLALGVGRGYFPLVGGEAEELGRLRLEPLLTPLALMAPTGSAGDQAEAALAPLGSVRYPAGRAPLTPEALRAATLAPRGVVVWDGPAGSVRAAAALRERGFAGSTVVRASVWEDLSALERAALTGAMSAVSPAALGYLLSDLHPSKPAVSSFRRALAGSGNLDPHTLTLAAAAWDGAALFGAAAEQVLAYADDDLAARLTADPGALRRALGDALAGLGPFVGAGGTYSFSAGGVQADSLVLGRWEGGGFRPLR